MRSAWSHTVRLLCFASVVLGAGIAEAAMQSTIEKRALAGLRSPLRNGARVTIARVPLADGKLGDLELEAFDFIAPDAVFEVWSDEGRQQIRFPAHRYFRGAIAGDADSMAIISLRENGDVVGLVAASDRKFKIETHRRRGRGPGEVIDDQVLISELSVNDELDPVMSAFRCDVEKKRMPVNASPLRATSNGILRPVSSLTPNGTRHLRIAIDTDFELYTARGSSLTSVNTYLSDLMAAANTVYWRDLKTELNLVYSRAFTTAADPWTVIAEGDGNPSTFDVLLQVGQVWNTATPFTSPRSAVMHVSGKRFPDAPTSFGGVAWVGTVCEGDFSFPSTNVPGGVGGRYGMFNGASYASTTDPIPNPEANAGFVVSTLTSDNSYWTLLAFTHELGHVVNGNHTHCTALTPADKTLYGVTRNWVDECYSGETDCFAGSGTVPTEKGSIMSYCHLTSGRGTATRYLFGKSTEPTQLIINQIVGNLDGKVPSVTAISSPATVTIGVSATASTTATAQSGDSISSYSWSIANGTITSATNAASVTFLPTANPVTLKVTVVSTLGCGVSDLKSIPAVTGTTLVKGDFTADGKADIALRNYTSGQNALWIMNGTLLSTIVDLPALTNVNFRIEGTADFNADGKTDIVLRNYSTGQNALWLMNGTALSSIVDLPALTNTAYHFEGVADFTADGKPDIILRNYTTGQNALWVMNGTVLSTIVDLPALPNTAYRIESAGDFSGDSKNDIVLRNYTTGQNALWVMNGTALSTIVDLPALPNTNYRIDGVGDFNADTKPDIVLRNYSTGQNAVWVMNGLILSTIADLPALTNTQYEINGPR